MGDIPLFGVDLGYGFIKVAGPGFRSKFPSAAAMPGAGSDTLGLVEWGQHKFFVGESALQQPVYRYADDMDKFTTPEEMAKYLAALAILSRNYDSRVMAIATGLPPMHYLTRGLGAQLEERLKGIFDFTYNGLPYRIEVPGVTVAPQSGAAFYDFYLYDDGEVNANHADLAGLRSITVDMGYKTTDLCLMNGLKAAMGNRSILSIGKGARNVFEEVARVLIDRYGLPLEDTEIERLWRTREPLRKSGQPVPLGELVANAAGDLAHHIAGVARRHAGDVRLWDVGLLVGGGAHLFEGVLSTALGVPVRMARQPEFANAAGYFKLNLMRR